MKSPTDRSRFSTGDSAPASEKYVLPAVHISSTTTVQGGVCCLPVRDLIFGL